MSCDFVEDIIFVFERNLSLSRLDEITEKVEEVPPVPVEPLSGLLEISDRFEPLNPSLVTEK